MTKKNRVFLISVILTTVLIIFHTSCEKEEEELHSDKNTASITDIDGNIYKTVVIGNQTWMAENLKVTHYHDGTAILHVTDKTAWANLESNDKAYCFNGNNSDSDYGAFYTYAAATNGDNSGTNVQGISPDGWHLPSDVEWKELIDYLGGTNIAGGKLKEAGTLHWHSPNTDANNESGFMALPGNFRASNGTFPMTGLSCYFWSATELSSHAWHLTLFYDYGSGNIGCTDKRYGHSVRCLKD